MGVRTNRRVLRHVRRSCVAGSRLDAGWRTPMWSDAPWPGPCAQLAAGGRLGLATGSVLFSRITIRSSRNCSER
jgi:hypothetical protein